MGYTREEVINKSFGDFLHPEWRDHFKHNFPRFKAVGEILGVEFEMMKKDGSFIIVNFNGKIGRDDKGAFKQTHCILHDITSQKRSEKALQESEERFRRLFETANDGILLLEKHELKIRYANPAITRLLRYSNEEFVGSDLKSVGFPEDIATPQEILQTLNKNGIYNYSDALLKNKDGQDVDADVYMVDKASLVQCNIRDITGKKLTDKRLGKIRAQLQQSQKMEAVGNLAGGIAHDFNNILAIILGNAELASDDVPDWNPASVSLKEIRRASVRAKDMVQQLLAFSRKTDEVSKPINMAPIIKKSLKMLKHAIPTSVEFKQHISDDSCNVMGNASQINQIVMNLVTNAADAMCEEGGLLEVTLENIILQEEKICFDWVLSPGPYVRLRMRDTGEGIEPKIMDRIFEPYYTTKEIGKGTGMGLSVIHGIVKRHGGGIRVESELEKGTLFEIYFPALEKAAVDEKEPAGEIKGGSERILFVDDETSMVNLNHQRLERLGYQVKSTTKSEEALEWFKADPDQFDVIITDMTMPRITGDRLAAEVLKIRPHMPVIICTGYSERISENMAEAIGVSKYIEKPMDTRNLAAALREVLEEN